MQVKVRSVSFLFLPTLYFPRWSDRGSTDPSISRCLDSLPSVHHGADPRPPTRSLHLPSGCCRCCSPPRPGEGPTGVCFSYLFCFSSIVSYTGSSNDTGKWVPAPRSCLDTVKCFACVLHCAVVFNIFSYNPKTKPKEEKNEMPPALF